MNKMIPGHCQTAPHSRWKPFDEVSHLLKKKKKKKKVSLSVFINHTIKSLNPNTVIRFDNSSKEFITPNS